MEYVTLLASSSRSCYSEIGDFYVNVPYTFLLSCEIKMLTAKKMFSVPSQVASVMDFKIDFKIFFPGSAAAFT